MHLSVASTVPFGGSVVDGRLMAVSIQTDRGLRRGVPTPLFPVRARQGQCEPSIDGTRFLINVGSGTAALPSRCGRTGFEHSPGRPSAPMSITMILVVGAMGTVSAANRSRRSQPSDQYDQAARAAAFCSVRHGPSTCRLRAASLSRSSRSGCCNMPDATARRSRSRQIEHGSPLRVAASCTTPRNSWPSSAWIRM